MTKIALIGDYRAEVVAHRAIPVALRAAATELDVALTWEFIHTSELRGALDTKLSAYHGIWCMPGSPYANPRGALDAIGFARTHGLPFLGTCGGFQHALIEYAEDVWGIEAAHAEADPDAAEAVIAPLMCSLIDVRDEVWLVPGTKLRELYGCERTREQYQCRFGLNPRHAQRLEQGPLRVAARDEQGDVRAVELAGHPFFIAALFQPERTALAGHTPVLAKAFVLAAAAQSRRAGV
jgi:CTP synthase (UTP-ammonia lyase)